METQNIGNENWYRTISKEKVARLEAMRKISDSIMQTQKDLNKYKRAGILTEEDIRKTYDTLSMAYDIIFDAREELHKNKEVH